MDVGYNYTPYGVMAEGYNKCTSYRVIRMDVVCNNCTPYVFIRMDGGYKKCRPNGVIIMDV